MKVMFVKPDTPAFNWVLFLALKDDQNAQGMGELQSLFAISPALPINFTVSEMMDSRRDQADFAKQLYRPSTWPGDHR